MKIINNTTEKLADDLRVTIKKRSRVSMAAACFSVYAFEELKAQLENLDELRFIFTSPAFFGREAKESPAGILYSSAEPRAHTTWQ